MSENLKRFLWMGYEHLGGLVLVNLVWSLLSLPWLALAYLLWNLGAGLGGRGALAGLLLGLEMGICAPPTVLLFVAGRRWARDQHAGLGEVLAESRRFLLRAQGLGLALAGFTLVLLVNAFFYQRLAGWPGLVLGGTMLWFLLAVGLTAPYLFPVLVTQDLSVWQTLRQSLLLAVDNIGLSCALLLATLLALALGTLSGVGLFCGALALLALFICVCFRALLPKYTGEVLPEEPRRRLRDLMRPWEA